MKRLSGTVTLGYCRAAIVEGEEEEDSGADGRWTNEELM